MPPISLSGCKHTPAFALDPACSIAPVDHRAVQTSQAQGSPQKAPPPDEPWAPAPQLPRHRCARPSGPSQSPCLLPTGSQHVHEEWVHCSQSLKARVMAPDPTSTSPFLAPVSPSHSVFVSGDAWLWQRRHSRTRRTLDIMPNVRPMCRRPNRHAYLFSGPAC